jgi:hypothetical protein
MHVCTYIVACYGECTQQEAKKARSRAFSCLVWQAERYFQLASCTGVTLNGPVQVELRVYQVELELHRCQL